MFNEITYFSNRRPFLFGLLTVVLITAVPWLFVWVAFSLFGENFPAERILLVFAFVIQIILCFKVDKLLLMMIPFIIMLIGVLSCECIYLASAVSVQSHAYKLARQGYAVLNRGIAVFGPEFVGIVSAIALYALISLIKRIRE